MPLVYVVMGVSGCGKSTVGALLAERLGCPFYEGDDFHPAANVAKMQAGTPLCDDDRWPWLQQLAAIVQRHLAAHSPAVISCLALKPAYRALLRTGKRHNSGEGVGGSGDNGGPRDNLRREDGELLEDRGAVAFVLLDPPRELLERRLLQRQHFMPASLLDSQLADLSCEPGDLFLHVAAASGGAEWPEPGQVVEAVMQQTGQ